MNQIFCLRKVFAYVAALFLLLTGCGLFGASGEIVGRMVGDLTNQPMSSTHVILCQIEVDVDGCTMVSQPTTQTDADGNFTLSGVPAGDYLLLYAPDNELTSTPDQWDDVQVGYPVMTLSDMGQFVSQGEGPFFVEEVEQVGQSLTSTDGNFSLFSEGYLRSNNMGISMMYSEQKRAPTLTVEDGQTAEIDWRVAER